MKPVENADLSDQAVDAAVRVEMFTALLDREHQSIRGSLVGIVAAWGILGTQSSWVWLAIWTVYRLVCLYLDERMCLHIRRMGIENALAQGWQIKFDVEMVHAAASWGVLLWFLPPMPWLFNELVLVIMLIVVRTVMLNTTCMCRSSLLTFDTTLAVMMAARVWQEHHAEVPLALFGVGMLSAILLYYGLHLNTQAKANAKVKVVNVQLLAQLSAAQQREAQQREALARMNEQLQAALSASRYQALHDPLTGCPNRLYFADHVQRELIRTRESPEQLAVGIVDFDHFKRINDEHGHPVGDTVLREGSRVMRAALRDGDVLARFGGEEFVLVIREATWERAAHVMERLRESLAQLDKNLLPPTLAPTVSIGWALLGEGQSLDEVLALADEALYRAKQSGRNRVEGPVRHPPSPSAAAVTGVSPRLVQPG